MLILNKLFSHALKHAFPDSRTNEITIAGIPAEDVLEIKISTIFKGFDRDRFPALSNEHDKRDMFVSCPDLLFKKNVFANYF
jgi:hypothetical protein